MKYGGSAVYTKLLFEGRKGRGGKTRAPRHLDKREKRVTPSFVARGSQNAITKESAMGECIQKVKN